MSLQPPQFYYKVDMPERQAPCIHQARLQAEDESSFSSLDSQVVSKHYGRTLFEKSRGFRSPKNNRYNYLDRSPDTSERAASLSRKHGTASNYEFTLHNTGRVQDYLSRDDKQMRIDQLLTQNQVLRGQLSMLKSTNSNIQEEVRKGSEEIKRMRRQLDKNFNEHQQMTLNPSIEDELKDRIIQIESKSRQLQHELNLTRRKYEHQREKSLKTGQELKNLKQLLRTTEEKLDQQLFRHNRGVRTTEEDFHQQAKYLRRIEARLKASTKQIEQQQEQYSLLMTRFREMAKKDSSHWKDNFIGVFLDMMKRVASKESFRIDKQFSLKKQTKLAWRYLKRLLHSYLKRQRDSIQ